MDKHYLKLFTEMTHTIEVLAEQVMELNKTKGDDKGVETATIMRDDYRSLYDRMRQENFDEKTLTKKDYARFLVGAIIVAQQIDNKIKNEKKALSGYKVDLIPKLERVINEVKSDDDKDKLSALIEELFSIKPEEVKEESTSDEK